MYFHDLCVCVCLHACEHICMYRCACTSVCACRGLKLMLGVFLNHIPPSSWGKASQLNPESTNTAWPASQLALEIPSLHFPRAEVTGTALPTLPSCVCWVSQLWPSHLCSKCLSTELWAQPPSPALSIFKLGYASQLLTLYHIASISPRWSSSLYSVATLPCRILRLA